MKVNLIKTICLFIAFNAAHVLANSTDNDKRAKDIKQLLINKNNIQSDIINLNKTIVRHKIQAKEKHTNSSPYIDSGDTDYFGNPIMLHPDGDTDYFGNPLWVESEKSSEYENILNELKTHYVNQIAARVRSQWRYHGAEDNWSCNVYVLQDLNGDVQSVDLHSCDISDNTKAKSFKDSIERAVYKASPLPRAPDKSVFNREIFIKFRVN